MSHIKEFTRWCSFCGETNAPPMRHGSHLKWTCRCTNSWETETWEQYETRRAELRVKLDQQVRENREQLGQKKKCWFW